MTSSETRVLESFTRIREFAEDHMNSLDLQGHDWDEEGVTEASVHRGAPRVRVVKFTKQHQEPVIGADYLWWWLDRKTGTCFGMLVQAKRLKHKNGSWSVDIRHGTPTTDEEKVLGRQYADLLKTAHQLKVPAMYAVYTGGLVFRKSLPCSHGAEPDCVTCRRMAISMISAYQMNNSYTPRQCADDILDNGIPVENLVDPALTVGVVNDLNLPAIPAGELRDFLTTDQIGPLEVAKRIFEAVALHRRGGWRAANPDPVKVSGAALFPEFPDDQGHFPGNYFEHFLQGAQLAPPRYVLELLRPPRLPDLPPASTYSTGSYSTDPSGTVSRSLNPPLPLRGLGLAGAVIILM